MKLLLHAGPMKTGSTAFQELLVLNDSLLEQGGIRFRHLRRQELDDLDAVVEDEQRRGWPQVLLLSHECLCRVDPQRLRAALQLVPAPAEAVLVARPPAGAGDAGAGVSLCLFGGADAGRGVCGAVGFLCTFILAG